MQESIEKKAEQPELKQCTELAGAFLKQYTKKADPGSMRKSLVGVLMFIFGTFVTASVTLGPNSGPKNLMSFLLPGFFLVMTCVMISELWGHYQWHHQKNAFVLKYMEKEARNHVEIRYALGYAYQTGALGPQDDRLAAQWYQKAEGYPFADNDMGVLYAQGKGVDRDLHKAHRLFKKAAAGGAMPAAANLAIVKELEQF